MSKTRIRRAHFKEVVLTLALIPGFLLVSNAMAEDPVKPGENVVTGNPSRVGPPWNHRPSIKIPSWNTEFSIGGYTKFDATYDMDYKLGNPTNPALVGGVETDGDTQFTASETRINFRSATDSDFGRLTTYVEGHFYQPDFVDGSGSTFGDGTFGLRHAYGTINGFLLGHTWSNYMAFVASPRLLKLGAPNGHPYARQAQIRYTHYFNPKSALSVSLEDPNTIVAVGSPTGAGETPVPDFTARYQYGQMFSIATVARYLQTGDSLGLDNGDSVFGYGVQVQFSYPILSSTTVRLAGSYGEGVGQYMGPPVASPVNYPDVYVEDGELRAVEAYFFGASLAQRWSAKWSSNVAFSYTKQDIPDNVGIPPLAFPETITYASANLIYDATPWLAFGIEYQRVSRENNRATAGSMGDVLDEDANRIQVSAIFQF